MAIKILSQVTTSQLEDFIYDIDVGDPKLYEELKNPYKIGLFQINGGTAEQLCEKMLPENFAELTALNAMARPGPLEASAPYYVARKAGEKSPYPDALNDLIQDTHQTFVYQEQVMEIFHKIGGFTLEEANEVRSLMKKLGKLEKHPDDVKKWEKVVQKFTEGASKNGITETMAKTIANDLAAFSGYSFNKCISGNCKIDRDNRARWSPTIEEMFLTKNDEKWAAANGHHDLFKKYRAFGYSKAFSLAEDARLYLNDIKDIYFAGRRIVYEILLENGKRIVVTKNHKFPTNRGELSIESGLSVGDFLYSNDGRDNEKFMTKYNFTDMLQLERIFKSYTGEGFLSGEQNSGYINGECIKFERNREKLIKEANGVCQVHFGKSKRLECHHKDGNRRNNEESNLVIACSGCHKKLEYQLGRTAKNEKGKLTSLRRIVEINEKGEQNTYDVEMASPYHTLSVDGIITSNSHASSYAYIAAITIYLSIYFRKWFYASVLAYEVDREKYLLDRLYSVKNQKIDILPPDINDSSVHFAPEGENVRFGLADIKYVSVTASEIIMKNRPYSSLFDFIMKTRNRAVTSKTISALISVGAFDSFSKERKRLLMLFESFWDKKGTSKVEDKLRAIFEQEEKRLMNTAGLDTTEDDLVAYEKEYFGFRFFSSPFKEKVTEEIRLLKLKNIIYASLTEVGKTPKKVPVFINSVRNHKDKNGNAMAFIEIEDVRGNRTTVPIFHSHFQYMGDLISENSLYYMYLYSENGKLVFGKKKERIDDYREEERRMEAARWLGKMKTASA